MAPMRGERRHAGEGSLLEAPRSHRKPRRPRTWWYLCGYTLDTSASWLQDSVPITHHTRGRLSSWKGRPHGTRNVQQATPKLERDSA